MIKKKNATSSKNAIKSMHFVHSLKEVLKNHKGEYVSFGEIIAYLKDEGLIFLIAVIALPTSIPVPTPPGFTSLFGIPLCILTWQLIYRLEKPWMPQWLSKRSMKVSTLQLFINKAEPTLNKLSSFLKPRHQHFTTKHMERIIGVIAFLCSVSLALPIVFGNAIPSAGIFIMALGLLYKDGLTVLVGMVVGIIGLIIASAVVAAFALLGREAVMQLIDKCSNFLF